MIIHHIALWTSDLERMKEFYVKYFGAVAGHKYTNPIKQIETYFLSFEGEAKLEIMHRQSLIQPRNEPVAPEVGYVHLALAIGSRGKVDQAAARFKAEGLPVLDGPRLTGDGYYEFTSLDPDGNRIEITE
jgi:lactoylglutathione lyase